MNAHSDPIAPVIFGVTLILTAALVGRYGARKFRQPSVLGELLMGVVIGNGLYFGGFDLMAVLREGTAALDMANLTLRGQDWDSAALMVVGEERGTAFLTALRGPSGGEYLQVAQAVDVFSRYGVIFLLFHVGLETCVAEMRQVGAESFRVATLGVLAPFALGFAVAWLLAPEASHNEHMFLAATLGATSVGITARVLRDLGWNRSREAHVIVGAAIIDDVLGLIMLAIVSGIVVTGSVELPDITRTVLLACLFIGFALLVGPYFLKALIWLLRRLDVMEAKLFISFLFVMVLAWSANLVGLATIVGAFTAGLLIMDRDFEYWGPQHHHKYSIKDLFAPLESILVPIFFVLMGIQVRLEAFLDWRVVSIALGLLVAAVIGKLVSGWGAGKDIRRMAVGVGMMPRGEVGLVFASIGKTLGVIETELFSAVVLMVIVTTLVTPPILKQTLGRQKPGETALPDKSVCK